MFTDEFYLVVWGGAKKSLFLFIFLQFFVCTLVIDNYNNLDTKHHITTGSLFSVSFLHGFYGNLTLTSGNQLWPRPHSAKLTES